MNIYSSSSYCSLFTNGLFSFLGKASSSSILAVYCSAASSSLSFSKGRLVAYGQFSTLSRGMNLSSSSLQPASRFLVSFAVLVFPSLFPVLAATNLVLALVQTLPERIIRQYCNPHSRLKTKSYVYFIYIFRNHLSVSVADATDERANEYLPHTRCPPTAWPSCPMQSWMISIDEVHLVGKLSCAWRAT